jgi:DNA-binding MarR family transcriptional regulator
MANRTALLAEAYELTSLLFGIVDRAQEDFRAVVAEEGLTPPLARMMLMLEQPRSMRDLADHLSCDASNVTGLTDRLAARGLVERVPGEDRRVKMVTLTDKGRALRARLAARVAEGSTVTRRLSDDQRAALRVLLEAMLVDD